MLCSFVRYEINVVIAKQKMLFDSYRDLTIMIIMLGSAELYQTYSLFRTESPYSWTVRISPLLLCVCFTSGPAAVFKFKFKQKQACTSITRRKQRLGAISSCARFTGYHVPHKSFALRAFTVYRRNSVEWRRNFPQAHCCSSISEKVKLSHRTTQPA